MNANRKYCHLAATTQHMGLWFCRFSGTALWPLARDPVPAGRPPAEAYIKTQKLSNLTLFINLN